MNITILDENIQKYIIENEEINILDFVFKKSPFENVSTKEISQQIKGRQIAQLKFPFLVEKSGIYYPPHINLEQASSEFTALYKQKLCNGETFLDLTGGMGIDTYFIGQNYKSITYVEKNEELFDISKHNLSLLFDNTNIEFVNCSAEEFISNNHTKYDTIYIDPSRRINGNRKFLLEELEPNIMELKNELFKISNRIVIKLSPLYDIKECINKLKNIAEIHIVSYKNEVKELLILLENIEIKYPLINSIELIQNKLFSFYFDEEISCKKPIYSLPNKYLYIPNNAILKAGCFNIIALKFNLKKLHPNTHIYTSDDYIENFIGKKYEVIENISKIEKVKGVKANIISKNYPLDVRTIKKKYKMIDGGTIFYIFTNAMENMQILKCLKLY